MTYHLILSTNIGLVNAEPDKFYFKLDDMVNLV